MPIKTNREYRAAQIFSANEQKEYIVEGYATTFDQPYLMLEDGDNRYFEMVSRNAFEDADTEDVIFQYDHEGMVFARTRNGTVQLEADDHGLKVIADLSLTEQSRQMYEAIRTGLISEMSFAFTVDKDSYDKQTRTRTIERIKKLYDVSAVSIPANPATTISARSYFDGVIEEEKQELLAAEERNRKIMKIKILAEV